LVGKHSGEDRAMSVARRHRLIDSQLLAFVRGHLVHVVLLLPGALLLTWLHEAAHASLVTIQGGSITEFQWLPSSSGLGHVRFTFPDSTEYSGLAISLAPHVLSILFVIGAILLSCSCTVRSDRASSYIYFWLYFIPVADIGFALLVWTVGGQNDMAKAFGPPAPLSVALVVIYGLTVCTLGYVLQRRLYDRLRLGIVPYSALVLTGLLMMVGILGLARI